MADISKIQVPGSATQYNIKDAQARSEIETVKADLGDVEELDTGDNTLVDAVNTLYASIGDLSSVLEVI